MGDRILIIPDVHGRQFFWSELRDPDEYSHIIFLGDYLDPYPIEGITWKLAENTFYQVVDYKKKNPEKVTLLLGNHDLPYLSEAVQRYGTSDRFNETAVPRLRQFFMENRSLFRMAWQTEIGGETYLFSHAGVVRGWLEQNGLTETWEKISTDKLADWLDNMSYTEDGIVKLGQCGSARWGWEQFGSPTWADWIEILEDGRAIRDGVYQIVGHTMSRSRNARIELYAACLDCIDQCFVKDSDGIKKV
jgi:hypothetical protein